MEAERSDSLVGCAVWDNAGWAIEVPRQGSLDRTNSEYCGIFGTPEENSASVGPAGGLEVLKTRVFQGLLGGVSLASFLPS